MSQCRYIVISLEFVTYYITLYVVHSYYITLYVVTIDITEIFQRNQLNFPLEGTLDVKRFGS